MAVRLYYTTTDIFCKVCNYYVPLHPTLALQILSVIWFTAVFNSKCSYILPTEYIDVFYVDLRIKQQLFPCTVLTDWFL